MGIPCVCAFERESVYVRTYGLPVPMGMDHGQHLDCDLYGVATVSRLLKIIGLFCRIWSLFKGSFAKETYHFKEPINPSHPIAERRDRGIEMNTAGCALYCYNASCSAIHTATQTATHTSTRTTTHKRLTVTRTATHTATENVILTATRTFQSGQCVAVCCSER